MKTLYATFEDKHGKVKTVKVRFEDDMAKLFEGASDDVRNAYIVEEYLVRNIERKETRRHQSLERSMEHGFDKASDEAGADIKILSNERAEILHRAIKKLSLQKQEMIRMIYFEGLSQDEVARNFGITKSAVSHTMHRMYAELKKFLS